MKRFKVILISYICVLIVVMLGDKIHVMNIMNKFDEEKEYAELYYQYAQWENGQLDTHPNYDNLTILIEIDKKLLYLIDMDTNKVIKKYVVATGKPSTPTPIGTFKIIEKAKWGGGFGSRWMRLNVPWGQYGIHGTDKPNSIGYNASHGCIRMRNEDIEELYSMVKYNTTVALVKGYFGPFGYGFRVLKPGDRGADVQEVQKRLKMKGYYYGSIDGIYGDGLKSALLKFLKDNNLPQIDRIDYNVYKKLGIILME